MGRSNTYECPNCGATLSTQCGFDDSCGVWKCTNCGHLNEITEGMIINERKAYHCPSCDTILNYQSDFDESRIYRCDECYKELYLDGSEYELLYRCPCCDEILNSQWLFSSYQDKHKCEECNAELHKDWDEYKIIYRCPNCNNVLNEQSSFCEDYYWTCRNCDSELKHAGSRYELIRLGKLGDNDSPSYNWNSSSEQSSSNRTESESAAERYRKQREIEAQKEAEKRAKKKAFRRKHWKAYVGGVLLLMLSLIIAGIVYEIKHMIRVGYSSESLIGKNYKEVVSSLEESGFTRIDTEVIDDLEASQSTQDELVSLVKIGRSDSFSETTKYPSNYKVVVTYHTMKMVAVPMSSKAAKGENYEDISKKFKESGFTNVTFEIEYDIITGWLTKDGEVKSVSIDGDKKYSEGDMYKVNSEIVINYHTLRKNKK